MEKNKSMTFNLHNLKLAQRKQRVPDVLYHGSLGCYKDYILRDGLLIKGTNKNWAISNDCLYLTRTPDRAAMWTKMVYEENDLDFEWDVASGVVFEIQTDQLDLDKLRVDYERGSETLDWVYWGDIPPSTLRLHREYDWTAEIVGKRDAFTTNPMTKTALRGEYWFIGGQAMGADGNIGDINHEGMVLQHIMSFHEDDLFRILKERGDPIRHMDIDLLDMNDFESEELIEAGFTPDELAVMSGKMDARDYGLKHLGWIRVRGNNVQMWKLTPGNLGDLANGIWDVDNDIQDTEEFYIEVLSPVRTVYSDIPFSVISAGDPGQLALDRSVVASREFSIRFKCGV